MNNRFATKLCLTKEEAEAVYLLLRNAAPEIAPTVEKPRKRMELWRKRYDKLVAEQKNCPQDFKIGDKVFVAYGTGLRYEGRTARVNEINWWNHQWHYRLMFRDGYASWYEESQIKLED